MDNQYAFLSDLEKKVFNWLSNHKILFTTQQKMFGYSGELGSATIDFILEDRGIVLRIMGEYWHSSAESKARDEFGKEQLINKGYIVVDIWGESLTEDKIDDTMQKAVQGIEVL